MKFGEQSFNIMEDMATSVFLKVLKGSNVFKVQYRVVSFGQNIALVKVNKFVKFDENILHFVKVMTEIC